MWDAHTARLVVLVGLAGCSNSSNREPFPLKADAAPSASAPPFGSSAPASASASAAPTAIASSAPDSSAPAPECATEKEPNGSTSQASEITRCITGELSGWTDEDYLKVKAPPNTTDMIIEHEESDGKINYSVTAGQGTSGGSSNFNMSFSDKAPKTKITPGTTYFLHLRWDSNGFGEVTGSRPYKVTVSFE